MSGLAQKYLMTVDFDRELLSAEFMVLLVTGLWRRMKVTGDFPGILAS
jgi:hypothetical protein